MFAKIHGRQGNGSVHVVGRRDHDGIDVFLVFEHVTIVGVTLGSDQMFGLELDHPVEARLRSYGIKGHRCLTRRGRGWQFDALLQPLNVQVEPVESFIGIAPVYIAQRHDVLACQVDQIVAAHSADPHAGDVQGVARRSESTTEDVPWNNGTRGTAGGDFSQERAARDLFLFAHDYLSRTSCIIARSRSLCEGKLSAWRDRRVRAGPLSPRLSAIRKRPCPNSPVAPSRKLPFTKAPGARDN